MASARLCSGPVWRLTGNHCFVHQLLDLFGRTIAPPSAVRYAETQTRTDERLTQYSGTRGLLDLPHLRSDEHPGAVGVLALTSLTLTRIIPHSGGLCQAFFARISQILLNERGDPLVSPTESQAKVALLMVELLTGPRLRTPSQDRLAVQDDAQSIRRNARPGSTSHKLSWKPACKPDPAGTGGRRLLRGAEWCPLRIPRGAQWKPVPRTTGKRHSGRTLGHAHPAGGALLAGLRRREL